MVGDDIVDRKARREEIRLDRAADGNMRSECFCKMNISGGAHHIPVAIPEGRRPEVLCRREADPAVRREDAALLALSADVVETAGLHGAADPLIDEHAVYRAERERGNDAVLGVIGQIRAFEAQIIKIHAKIRRDREYKACRVVELEDTDALRFAGLQLDLADARDLIHVGEFLHQRNIHGAPPLLLSDLCAARVSPPVRARCAGFPGTGRVIFRRIHPSLYYALFPHPSISRMPES